MYTELLKRNKKHLAQTKNTPFVNDRHYSQLGIYGNTEAATEILEGNGDAEILETL